MTVARRLLACALLAAPLPAWAAQDEDAALCRSGQGPAIQVNISDLKDQKGEIWLELYPDSEADFLRDDTALAAEHKTFRRTRTRPLGNGTAVACVRVPHAGRYALLVRHNRLGKDAFSVWNDGIGFPDNAPIGLHRPKYAKARMEAGAGVTVLNVKMQYLHGLRGFAPG